MKKIVSLLPNTLFEWKRLSTLNGVLVLIIATACFCYILVI